MCTNRRKLHKNGQNNTLFSKIPQHYSKCNSIPLILFEKEHFKELINTLLLTIDPKIHYKKKNSPFMNKINPNPLFRSKIEHSNKLITKVTRKNPFKKKKQHSKAHINNKSPKKEQFSERITKNPIQNGRPRAHPLEILLSFPCPTSGRPRHNPPAAHRQPSAGSRNGSDFQRKSASRMNPCKTSSRWGARTRATRGKG